MVAVFCRYDIDELAEQYGRFSERDTQVMVVLQSSRESINGLKGETRAPFSVICDTDHAFYKALDVRAAATRENRMPKAEEDKAIFNIKMAAARKETIVSEPMRARCSRFLHCSSSITIVKSNMPTMPSTAVTSRSLMRCFDLLKKGNCKKANIIIKRREL